MPDRETMTNEAARGTGDGPSDAPRPSEPLPPRSVGGESVDAPSPPEASAPADPPVIGSASPMAISTYGDQPPVSGVGGAGLSAPGGRRRIGDRVFSTLAIGSGGGHRGVRDRSIAVFLLIQAVPAIVHDKSNFLFSRTWSVDRQAARLRRAAACCGPPWWSR